MLSGVRVLDLSGEPGWLVGRILSDLGADVVRVEPPGGDRVGRRGPYLRGVDDPEQSLSWLVFQAGKRGITFDGTVPAARWARAQLFSWADVVIETFEAPVRAAWGLDAAGTEPAHRRLVHCSITPFGRTGPYAEFRGGDLVVVASSGGTVRPDPDRPPVRSTGRNGTLRAGPEAALGVVMALQARSATGRGRHVDVSLQECLTRAMPPSDSDEPLASIGRRAVWAARDGWVVFRAPTDARAGAAMRALVAWMAESDAAPDWLLAIEGDSARSLSLDAGTAARLEQAMASFFAARTRDDLFAGALARGIPLAPCNDVQDVARQVQLRSRELFTTLDLPACDAEIEIPGAFARSSAAAIGVRRRAPRIGEHQHEVFAEAGIGRAECEKLAAEGAT